jgi:HPt (histidine-containing phosphotransfer) domain-containing protein
MAKETKIVDLTYLNNMSEGDVSITKELIDIFIGQVDEFINEMNELYENKEWVKLGMLAHKAKSSIVIMGMDKLAKELKDFELLAKNGKKTETYRNYIDNFSNQCRMAVDELKEIYKTL